MTIRDYIYYAPTIISIIGVISIIFALKNKKRKNNRLIIIFNIVNILYLFIITQLIPNNFPIIVDLGIIIIWIVSFIGDILYIVSLIICIIKNRKLRNDFDNRVSLKIFIIIILIPIITFVISLFREIYLINNSEMVLSFHSSGYGNFGSSCDFVYVVSNKYFKEISVDVELSYSIYNKMLLPPQMKEMTKNDMQNNEIEIIMENKDIGTYVKIYKSKELIYKKKLNEKYYNNELKSVFYNS